MPDADGAGDAASGLLGAEVAGAELAGSSGASVPEHPAPAGAYDVYAGLVYLATHAKELGIDPAKIGGKKQGWLYVCGVSSRCCVALKIDI